MHISCVKDGAIVKFAENTFDKVNCCFYMKTCGKDGIGRVVRLLDGLDIPVSALAENGINPNSAEVIADNLDTFYYDDEE